MYQEHASVLWEYVFMWMHGHHVIVSQFWNGPMDGIILVFGNTHPMAKRR